MLLAGDALLLRHPEVREFYTNIAMTNIHPKRWKIYLNLMVLVSLIVFIHYNIVHVAYTSLGCALCM